MVVDSAPCTPITPMEAHLPALEGVVRAPGTPLGEPVVVRCSQFCIRACSVSTPSLLQADMESFVRNVEWPGVDEEDCGLAIDLLKRVNKVKVVITLEIVECLCACRMHVICRCWTASPP